MHIRTKRAGLLTKIVILALLVATATSLLRLQSKIRTVKSEVAELSSQVEEQTQSNAELSDAVNNSKDPEVLESVARSKGYVVSGEKIFVDVAG